MSLHIYGVELSAFRVMLGSLEEVLLGQVIRIESDNTMIVAYIFGTVRLFVQRLSLCRAFYNVQGQDCLCTLSPFSRLARALAEIWVNGVEEVIVVAPHVADEVGTPSYCRWHVRVHVSC